MESYILNINIDSMPKWMELFQKYIELKLNIDNSTSKEVIRGLYQIMKQNRELLDKNKLNKIAFNEAQKWHSDIGGSNEEWNKRCFKEGFKIGFNLSNQVLKT